MQLRSGSSPRARGTRRRRHERRAIDRFIPASAGNTQASSPAGINCPVHPRERGEHGESSGTTSKLDGSSPRARGTRCARQPPRWRRRFIPASAGNTSWRCAGARRSTVHPRERGEHAMARRRVDMGVGSSPRARGTHEPEPKQATGERFIPASAGNTTRQAISKIESPGSSPRARGTRPCPHCGTMQRGSSPRARGTLIPCIGSRRFAVHPRERGEHIGFSAPTRTERGSSPRARGNTCASRWWRQSSAVHPRERGEHEKVRVCTSPSEGSSPRARGTPRRGRHVGTWRRFIPASAGNTSR